MKRPPLGLIASMMLLPVFSFAQTTPQAPASWTAFQKEERAKRVAFFNQMKTDTDAFLSAHPDVKAYLDKQRADRLAQWKAAHHK